MLLNACLVHRNTQESLQNSQSHRLLTAGRKPLAQEGSVCLTNSTHWSPVSRVGPGRPQPPHGALLSPPAGPQRGAGSPPRPAGRWRRAICILAADWLRKSRNREAEAAPGFACAESARQPAKNRAGAAPRTGGTAPLRLWRLWRLCAGSACPVGNSDARTGKGTEAREGRARSSLWLRLSWLGFGFWIEMIVLEGRWDQCFPIKLLKPARFLQSLIFK